MGRWSDNLFYISVSLCSCLFVCLSVSSTALIVCLCLFFSSLLNFLCLIFAFVCLYLSFSLSISTYSCLSVYKNYLSPFFHSVSFSLSLCLPFPLPPSLFPSLPPSLSLSLSLLSRPLPTSYHNNLPLAFDNGIERLL